MGWLPSGCRVYVDVCGITLCQTHLSDLHSAMFLVIFMRHRTAKPHTGWSWSVVRWPWLWLPLLSTVHRHNKSIKEDLVWISGAYHRFWLAKWGMKNWSLKLRWRMNRDDDGGFANWVIIIIYLLRAKTSGWVERMTGRVGVTGSLVAAPRLRFQIRDFEESFRSDCYRKKDFAFEKYQFISWDLHRKEKVDHHEWKIKRFSRAIEKETGRKT